MIIARSPLRITLGGGGTDLPSYYRQHGGFVISAAIDKFVYVTVMRPFVPGIYLKYSQIEKVKEAREVKHKIIREALTLLNELKPQVEITTLADIPAGTGLGSSGSFTTALLKALMAFKREAVQPGKLAQMACEIEMDRLGEPVGKQDQYIAAYGGITCFNFNPDETVKAERMKLSDDVYFELEDRLLLFFTGFDRSAGDILKDQKERTVKDDPKMLENLHRVKEMGLQSKKFLENGKILELGELMHVHWENKKKRSQGMSNSKIDEWYELGKKNGAVGGKLVGAGGGGFLLFVAEDHARIRKAMAHAGLDEVRFHFEHEGTKQILA